MEKIIHPIPPLYDGASKILILGSFPSVKSREGLFFYHHPQNRFWKVLAAVLGAPVPASIEEKRQFLIGSHVAVWDVIASCTITGSSDSSIRNVKANDIAGLLKKSRIRAVYANGGTAYRLYQKFCFPDTGLEAVCLPSTSPANAAWTLPRLLEAWKIILPEEEPQGQVY